MSLVSPIAMTLLLVAGWGIFAWSAKRRWRLMTIGPPEHRFDRLGERFRRMMRFAFGQWRMPRYRLAGVAHIFIYAGAVVMLLRGLILFGRGYSANPHFGYVVFNIGTPLGNLYSLIKDAFVVAVLVGIAVYLYYRAFRRLGRMTINFEGFLILAILTGLMLSDMLYDGARMAWHGEAASMWEPLGSLVASPLRGASHTTLAALTHLGFWGHVSLILGFLNYLPYCKQFHEITAFPNVFFQSLEPPGRLRKVEDLEGMVEREETLGKARIEQFHWKSILDFYTCTECGRCSDNCPATKTGKLLSPKHLTVNLRNHLYSRQNELIRKNGEPERIDLVGQDAVINPEVIWACTSCRACEQECPVFITYVDKIIGMRQHVVQERGDFPQQLATAFRGIENSGNPWNLPGHQRTAWAEGLDVPRMADKGEAEWLLWVGCGPAYDDKAVKIARAMAQLLNMADVDYAILGEEEQCNGDPARRAGNEFLFQAMAEANVEILKGYGVKKIITICPHCFNTLKHEYPDFGGDFEVVAHPDLLARLVREGKLRPRGSVDATVVYHDSCYLGRYNEIYESPRSVLAGVPGVRLVEAAASRDRGMCCGAGGAQFFKEEEPGDERVNYARADQLISTGATVVASACPFCKSMLSDGISSRGREEEVKMMDIAEVLLQSVVKHEDTDRAAQPAQA